MAVLDRPTTHKQLTTSLLGGLLLGALVFGILLVSSATTMSTTTGVIQGGPGPLKLFELSRLPLAGGGYTGSIRFLGAGLATYFALWLSAGVMVWTVRK